MKYSDYHEYNENKVYDSDKTMFCYLKVSTQKQIDEGNSIDQQFHCGLRVSNSLKKELCVLNEGRKSSVERDSKTKIFLIRSLIQQKKP